MFAALVCSSASRPVTRPATMARRPGAAHVRRGDAAGPSAEAPGRSTCRGARRARVSPPCALPPESLHLRKKSGSAWAATCSRPEVGVWSASRAARTRTRNADRDLRHERRAIRSAGAAVLAPLARGATRLRPPRATSWNLSPPGALRARRAPRPSNAVRARNHPRYRAKRHTGTKPRRASSGADVCS